MPVNVFSILPGNFFSLLSGLNREHYAALLVLYYRLFQENTRSLDREVVIREFTNYLALHQDSLEEEGNEEPMLEDQAELPTNSQEEGSSEIPSLVPNKASAITEDRTVANRFLRRLISTGWLSPETLADHSSVINITAWGKPFMKALADIDGGLKTEYESHVVTVYSMLCGETIQNDGHHAVLKAHEESRSLIDSLKVLSQSIKGYYDNLNLEVIRAKAALALHEHYDLYMGEVLDKAYKRLKTSDNVSRYRQGIFKQVATLLDDDQWLNESASKYMRILQTSRQDCRKRLVSMLEEIRDDLRSVDPLEDEIDGRNAAYSRSSTEIIKAYIEPDSTIAGKIGKLIKALLKKGTKDQSKEELEKIAEEAEKIRSVIAHSIYRINFLSPASLAFRKKREEGDFAAAVSQFDLEALDQNEKEFLERMRKRLSLTKIHAWLDEQGGKDRPLSPQDLIMEENSYIRFLYALLYGDSRNNFGYAIEETNDEKTNAASIKAMDYVVPDVRFRKNASGDEG